MKTHSLSSSSPIPLQCLDCPLLLFSHRSPLITSVSLFVTKGSTQTVTSVTVGFSQSERLQAPERGTEIDTESGLGSLTGGERLNVPGRGPESDIVMESIPRPTSTGTCLPLHQGAA